MTRRGTRLGISELVPVGRRDRPYSDLRVKRMFAHYEKSVAGGGNAWFTMEQMAGVFHWARLEFGKRRIDRVNDGGKWMLKAPRLPRTAVIHEGVFMNLRWTTRCGRDIARLGRGHIANTNIIAGDVNCRKCRGLTK